MSRPARGSDLICEFGCSTLILGLYCGLILKWESKTMFATVYSKSSRWKRRGRCEMYIVFLYLGFNLLNISKTATPE